MESPVIRSGMDTYRGREKPLPEIAFLEELGNNRIP
jgi:hypothetical protein